MPGVRPILFVATAALVGCTHHPLPPFEAFMARRGLSEAEFCDAWHQSEDKYGGFEGAALALPISWTINPEINGSDLDFGPAEVIDYAKEHCVEEGR